MSVPLKPLGLAAALALLAACQPAAPAADANAGPAADAAADTAAEPAMDAHADAAPADATPAAPQLQAAMRDLWHGHIVHARDYAMAVHAGDQARADAAANAVVDNAKQISGAVAGFYGDAAGAQMLDLLAGHWGAVKALTDAGARDDKAASDQGIADLTANAGEIARFLAAANPNLPEDTVRGMLLAHGAHHAQQIRQVMAGDTAGETQTWAAMQSHMDAVADALAAAIAAQFPDKAS